MKQLPEDISEAIEEYVNARTEERIDRIAFEIFEPSKNVAYTYNNLVEIILSKINA